MTKDEALVLALEALKYCVEQGGGPVCEHESGGAVCFCKENTAIKACEEALARPAALGLIESLKDAQICCGEYETCWSACTPRGKFFGQRDAQRTWVGLTDEEILEVSRGHYNPHQRPEISFAHAIEAKLKEKNT